MGACWIIIAACGAISKTKSLNQHSRNEIRAKGCFKKKLLTKKVSKFVICSFMYLFLNLWITQSFIRFYSVLCKKLKWESVLKRRRQRLELIFQNGNYLIFISVSCGSSCVFYSGSDSLKIQSTCVIFVVTRHMVMLTQETLCCYTWTKTTQTA